MVNRLFALYLIILSLLCFTAPHGNAQSNPTYIQFAPSAVKGALYKPDPPMPAARVGILVVHRTGNVMGSLACTELAKRGYMVLCLNPSSRQQFTREKTNREDGCLIGADSGIEPPVYWLT